MRDKFNHLKVYIKGLRLRCKQGKLTSREKVFLFLFFFPKTQFLILIGGLIYMFQ